MIMVHQNTALEYRFWMIEEDEDKTYFFAAISVVIIGEGGNFFMLNEIVAKGVR